MAKNVLENSVKRWLKEFGKKVKEFSKGVREKGNNQKET
jgi:transposase-like protein